MSPVTAKPSISAAPSKAGVNYVRFSDKLTDGLNDITRIIEDNKQTLDSIQEIGIELTHAIATLGETAVKYVRMIDSFLDTVVPLIEKVPFIDGKILKFAKDAQALAQSILDNSTNAQKVATNVRGALTTADVGQLKGYTGELKQLSKTLQTVVAKIK